MGQSFSERRSHPVDAVPLCVDLDGTLVKTDLFLESWFALFKRHPWRALQAPLWLLHGKARLKEEIARRIDINPAQLPYHPEFLAYLKQQRESGRRLVLATAAHERHARAVADYLGIFSDVIATTTEKNLSGQAKCGALCACFGSQQFDYAGNESADLKIFPHARHAVLVNPRPGVERKVRRLGMTATVFPSDRHRLRPYVRAVRAHQWLKNLLLFVPLLAAHAYTELAPTIATVIGFFAFCACASAVYLINDLLDLPADRAHPRKRKRPFAAGDIPIHVGLALTAVLFSLALGLSLFLPGEFLWLMAGYVSATFAYSLWLKGKVLVDVFVLASLYTIRVMAGGAAAGIDPSFWLLAFSMFLFLSLAMIKRYTELSEVRQSGTESVTGRGYMVADLYTVQALGAAAGYLSVLVLALYINTDDVRLHYQREYVLWFLCPLLLYWISRMWQRAGRDEMHDDPLVFAMKDRVSLGIFLVAAAVTAVAV